MRTEVSPTQKMVGTAILAAVVVALQFIATYITFTFSITLTLVPIVIGAAMYGAASGAFLGAAFSVVVLIGCLTGVDVGGAILLGVNPVVTVLLIFVKGILAGLVAALVYTAASKKNVYVGVVCAAIAAPVVNTGVFILMLSLLFRPTFIEWAGEDSLFYFAFIGLAGANFLLEFGINIVLSPVIIRVINAVKGDNKAKV